MFFEFNDLSDSNRTTTFVILGLLAFLVISYSVRLVLKGRAQYDRVDKQGGSALLSKGLMEMGYWGLQPIGRAFVLMGITPNMISWTSLVIGLLAGACLSFGHFGFGALFAMISFFFDSLDGIVARMTGVASDAGEVLDTTIDRYVEACFLGGLIIYYHPIPVLQVLALVALIGSFMVSYSSSVAGWLQANPPKGSMKRPERAVLLTLGALLSPITIPIFERASQLPIKVGHPMVFALGIIAVMANFSAIERMAAIAREIRAREARNRKAHMKMASKTVASVTSVADETGAEEPMKLR